MTNTNFLRGMATVNFWAEDVVAARDWYAKLFGVPAYFQMPNAEYHVSIHSVATTSRLAAAMAPRNGEPF
jgi:hypothetical protein